MSSEYPPALSKEDALRAYGRMMNHLSSDHLEPFLSDDFHYESQWVFSPIKSKEEFLKYIRPKLETIKKSGNRVWAETAELSSYPRGPCLVLAQGEKFNLVATLLVAVEGGKLRRADLCLVPPPQSAVRSGEYPL